MTTRNHYKQNYSRPRIQRAFILWLAESQRRFAVPLRIARRRKKFIELNFPEAKSMISVTLTSWEINVRFDWQGVCWDWLICFEVMPDLSSSGYVCSLCDPALCDPVGRTTYPSRELLWRAHLFEPFLDWVNNHLAKSPWIEIYGSEGNSSYARLLDSLPENLRAVDADNRGCKIIANPLCVP